MESKMGEMNDQGVGLPIGYTYDPKQTYYMSVHTGTVQTEEDWMADFEDRDIDDESTLDEWVLNLVEVKLNDEGKWIDV